MIIFFSVRVYNSVNYTYIFQQATYDQRKWHHKLNLHLVTEVLKVQTKEICFSSNSNLSWNIFSVKSKEEIGKLYLQIHQYFESERQIKKMFVHLKVQNSRYIPTPRFNCQKKEKGSKCWYDGILRDTFFLNNKSTQSIFDNTILIIVLLFLLIQKVSAFT